jgi:hypothetical protein
VEPTRLAIDWWHGRRSEDQPADFALALAEAELSVETQWLPVVDA